MPQDLIDFKDQVFIILNFGKYSAQTVTIAPAWFARNGEFVFWPKSAADNRLYFYANNQWNFISGGLGGASAAGQDQEVQVNSGGFFYADSGFKYAAHTAVGIRQDMAYVYDSNSSSGTYAAFSSSSQFLEFFVGSEIRLQM